MTREEWKNHVTMDHIKEGVANPLLFLKTLLHQRLHLLQSRSISWWRYKYNTTMIEISGKD